MHPRHARPVLVLFAVALAAVALAAVAPAARAQVGPRVVHYKVCPRCGYRTENVNETTCPNCTGRGPSAPIAPPEFTGFQPTGTPKDVPTTRKLTLGDNIRIGLVVVIGSGTLIAVGLGVLFGLNYLATSARVRRADPPPRRRNRRWDDDD